MKASSESEEYDYNSLTCTSNTSASFFLINSQSEDNEKRKQKEFKFISNKKDYLLKFFSILLTFSATSTEAILIATGMDTLMEGWRIFKQQNKKRNKKIISSSAAVLGVSVEGTVYNENIDGAFTALFSRNALEHYTVRSLLIEEYNEYRKTKSLKGNENPFLESYAKLYRLLSFGIKLEEHDQTEDFNKEIFRIKASLYFLEKQAILYCKTKKREDKKRLGEKFKLNLTDGFRSLYNKKILKKRLQFNLFLFFSLISTPSLLPVSFYYAGQLFLFFGIVGIVATVGVYVVTAVAIISSLLITYFTLGKIVQEDIFEKFFSNYKKTISHHYKENNWGKLIFIFVATLIFFASVAILLLSTFGTYSQTGATGFAQLFHSSVFIAKTITLPFCLISTLMDAMFNITNLGETIDEYSHFFSTKKIANFLSQQFNKLFVKPFKDLFLAKTSLYQRSWAITKIPIAIITLIPYVYNIATELLGFAIFIGHVISEAAPMDKPLWISKYPAVINNGLYEVGCGHCVAPHKEEEKPNSIEQNTELKPLEYESHSHSKNLFTCIQLPFHYLNAVLYFLFTGLSWKECKQNKLTPHWEEHNHRKDEEALSLFMRTAKGTKLKEPHAELLKTNTPLPKAKPTKKRNGFHALVH